MHVFGRWEEAGVPGENPRIRGENMQTPHRKAICKAVFAKVKTVYPDMYWHYNEVLVI